MHLTQREPVVDSVRALLHATVRHSKRTPRKRATGVLHQFEQDASGRTLVLAEEWLPDDPREAAAE
jgi:hypothetical protein